MASPTRGRRESTVSQEGGTEAQELGAEGKKSGVRACGGGRRGTTTPGMPCGLRRMRLAGNSSLAAFTGQWDAGERPDPDSQGPMAVQGRRGLPYHSPCARKKPHLKGRAGPSSGGQGDQRQRARRRPRERRREGPGPREARAGRRRGRGQGRGLASLWSGS